MPKVSIIVPIYNAKLYVSRLIDSIRNQTFTDYELLLVDDGSTDGSSLICDSYVQKDNRIKVFHTDNNGPSAARNIGLKNMLGEFLYFSDADDYLDSRMLALLMDEYEKTKAEMIICEWFEHNGNEVKRSNIGKKGFINPYDVAATIGHEDFLCGGGFLWNRLIRYKDICDRFGKPILFPEGIDVIEDKVWLINILKHTKDVYLSEQIGYHYIIRKDSLTRRSYEQKRYALEEALCQIYESLDYEKIPLNEKEYYLKLLVRKTWYLLKNKKGDFKRYKKILRLGYDCHFLSTKENIKAMIIFMA